jgi:hypothetical protein
MLTTTTAVTITANVPTSSEDDFTIPSITVEGVEWQYERGAWRNKDNEKADPNMTGFLDRVMDFSCALIDS